MPPEVIRATCPTHGPSNFLLFYSKLGDWYRCESWVNNWDCTGCIFLEDLTPDGAEVREFLVVIEGILNSAGVHHWSITEGALWMRRARGLDFYIEGTQKRDIPGLQR